MQTSNDKNLIDLASFIRKINATGHNPATSGNYSVRSALNKSIIFVSESGIDKSFFDQSHLIPVDLQTGKNLPTFENKKISYEAQIHLTIYEKLERANCVLHSHFLESLLACDNHQQALEITDLEIIKAFSGISSHNEKIQIPIIENSQNIDEICNQWKIINKDYPTSYGFLIRNHGLYCWGDSITSAKRHLEAFEYIFKLIFFRKMKG